MSVIQLWCDFRFGIVLRSMRSFFESYLSQLQQQLMRYFNLLNCKVTMNKATQSHLPDRATFALMGIAALLIVNSHLEMLYPKSFMAADGLVGNIIFFALAGYGVTLSQLSRPDPILPFYLRRIVRLYPSVVVAVLVGLLFHTVSFDIGQPIEWLKAMIWPTSYGFVSAIVIFYPLLWILARSSTKIFKYFVAGVVAIWFGIWVFIQQTPVSANLSLGQLPSILWLSFFFLATCVGALLARISIPNIFSQGWWAFWVASVMYVGLKFELALRIISSPVTISSTFLAGFLQMLALALVSILLVKNDALNELLSKLQLKSLLEWVGKMSLQTYLLHMTVCAWVKDLPVAWWLQIPLVFIVTLVVSWILLKTLAYIQLPKKAKLVE
jgi:peptidoglycan/LPS O-acetylase OafA/YrhL